MTGNNREIFITDDRESACRSPRDADPSRPDARWRLSDAIRLQDTRRRNSSPKEPF